MTYSLEELSQGLDSLWIGIAAILVFWMQAGFAMLESGGVRRKNTQNILFKNFMDICITTILWWLLGYGMAYGTGEFIGGDKFNTDEYSTTDYRDWLFQWAFAGTTMTIVSGCMAERTTIHGYFILTVVMNLLIYPWIVHWTWGGDWLSEGGFTDFAGSGIVHLCGGIAGLVGAIMVGVRKGRFDDKVDQNKFRGHNIPLVVLGTFILWMGWYGFNGGSVLAIGGENEETVFIVMMNTTISAVSAGITSCLVNYGMNYNTNNKYDIGLLCNGILAGLVSITASCDGVTDYGSFFIGVIGGLIYKASSDLLQKLKIDDPIDAFSVHGMCGIWGVLAVGFFNTTDGVFYGGNGKLLGWQTAGVLSICAWSGGIMLLFAFILNRFNLLRVSEEVEEKGLDFTEHGGDAYRLCIEQKQQNPETEMV
jgi:Amt family ammonium transporter